MRSLSLSHTHTLSLPLSLSLSLSLSLTHTHSHSLSLSLSLSRLVAGVFDEVEEVRPGQLHLNAYAHLRQQALIAVLLAGSSGPGRRTHAALPRF